MTGTNTRKLSVWITLLVLFTAIVFIIPTFSVKAEDVWDGTVASSFAGGSGTEKDPYQIGNGQQLAYLVDRVNSGDEMYNSACYIMTSDIFLNGTLDDSPNAWTPIGQENGFIGKFNGNGHTISGIYINSTDELYYDFGLFARLGSNGIIINVGLADGSVTSSRNSGGICGYNFGTIAYCYNTCDVSGASSVGGICAYNSGTVTDCYNAGKVYSVDNNDYGNGYYYAGGFCGYNCGKIKNCYYNKDLCTADGIGFSETTGSAVGLTTIEMTSDKALDIMSLDKDMWVKKANDKLDAKVFFPWITEDGAPSAGYETKLEIALPEGHTPVYGGDIKLKISALVRFVGMDEYTASEPSEGKGTGTFMIKCNGNLITETAIALLDNSTVEYTITDSGLDAGKHMFTLVYCGENSNFFYDDSVSSEITISKADCTRKPECELTLTLAGDDTYTAVITAVDGAEYWFGEGDWSSSNTLTGIDHATVVKAYIRYAENDNYNAGSPASVSKTTGHGYLTYHAPNAATCTNNGNIKYWSCDKCALYFSNEDGSNGITLGQTVLNKTGHDIENVDYSMDESGHWKVCRTCIKKISFEDHISGGEATIDQAEICTVCGYEISPKLEQAAVPVISPNGGTFSFSKTVTITSATDGASIYYTTDGSEPTESSTQYSGEFTLTDTATVKAIAVRVGMADSETASAEFVFVEPVTVTGHNLLLGDDIGVKFFMSFDEELLEADNSEVRLTVNDRETVVALSAAEKTDNVYAFVCPVAAAEMNDIITAQLYVDGKPVGDEFTYSVKTYADYILDNAAEYPNEVPLVEAMLNYGALAERYFTGSTEMGFTVPEVRAWELEEYEYTLTDNDEDLDFVGQVITLRNKITAKLYFNGRELSVSDFEVTQNGVAVSASRLTVDSDDNGTYLSVAEISPDEMGSAFEVTVGGVTISNYSVYSYVRCALASVQTALAEVAAALYEYGCAAEVYSSAA
ncbi:MAG: chitobiase/beta-hexosaminidase C-terminal domain-containing protein [Oscillospiraceae bacterium]